MRRALVNPIPEVFAAARVLISASKAHIDGDWTTANELFRQADCPLVWAYTDRSWGKGAKERFKFVNVPDPLPYFPLQTRPKPRMPSRVDKEIVKRRDHWHCRFCGIPLVDPAVRDHLKRIYPGSVGWPRTNVGQHAAFQCMWLQFDHLVPNSRGGDSSVGNVVLTCAPCNFGRMEATLEEAQVVNPLEGQPVVAWDGYAAWRGLEQILEKAALIESLKGAAA